MVTPQKRGQVGKTIGHPIRNGYMRGYESTDLEIEVRILSEELRCCYKCKYLLKAMVCEDRSLSNFETIKTLYIMNDNQKLVDSIVGNLNKTVLRTTPNIPTFTVKTVENVVAKIDYWDYEDTKGKTFDDIIDIVKKSINLPVYNKMIGDCYKKTITLYRRETVVIQ